METLPICIEIQYLPSIPYFKKWINQGRLIIDDKECFEKQSYRNRCTIAGANGSIDLIIPVFDSRGKLPIRSVLIDNHSNWQKQHWKSIKSAYGKTAFFEHFEHYFAPLYEVRYEYLFEFDWTMTERIMKILKMPATKVSLFSACKETDFVDYRNKIHPKPKFRDPDLAINPAPYHQAFEQRHGYIPNLSIIDLLFNEGPESRNYLAQQ